eukprot:764889-Hanusia_phi.AAC.3
MSRYFEMLAGDRAGPANRSTVRTVPVIGSRPSRPAPPGRARRPGATGSVIIAAGAGSGILNNGGDEEATGKRRGGRGGRREGQLDK